MKDNVLRLRLAHNLEKRAKNTKQNLWRVAGRKVGGPGQNRSLVNVGEIARNTKDGSTVLVAGKVLGSGELGHPVIVGALSFSHGARSKILKSGGKCFDLEEFMNQNKSAKGVVVLG